MTPHQSVYIDWKLFIWLPVFIPLSSNAMKILIYLWGISLWLWHHRFWIYFAPPFPSQTSFRNKVFQLFLFLEIDVCRAFWHKNKCEEIYRNKSTHVSKLNKNFWLIIHDKLKDLFTTIKHRFLDFAHN